MKMGLNLVKEIFRSSERHASIVVQVLDDYWARRFLQNLSCRIRLWILNCRSEHRALSSYMYVLLRLHDGQNGALFVPQLKFHKMWGRPLHHQVSVQAIH